MSTLRRLVFVLGSLLAVTLSLAPGAFSTDWTHSFEKKITWFAPTAPRILVVGAEDAVCGLDPQDGAVLWKIDVKKLDRDRFEIIPDTPYAFVRFKKNTRGTEPVGALVDLRTGDEVWTTDTIGVGECYGHIMFPPLGGMLIHGKTRDGKKVGVAVALETGEELWRVHEPFRKWKPDVYGASAQPPLFDSEDTVILFLNKKSLRKYNFRTGELIWETSQKLNPRQKKVWEEEFVERESSAPIYGYGPMALDREKGIVYAPYQNAVAAFRVGDGSSVWEDPHRLPGVAVQLAPVPEGLVVATIPEETGDEKLLLLDGATGKGTWELPEGKLFKYSGVSSFLLQADSAYVAAGGKLLAVHCPSGAFREIADLGFEGSDMPHTIEASPEGYLVVGFQNLAGFTPAGTRRWHVFHPAPSGAMGGLGMLIAAVAVNSVGPKSLGGGTTMEVSMDYSAGLDEFLREYGATAEDANAVYILTDPEEADPQVVKLSKVDGSVLGRAVMDDKTPDYQVDPYLGYIYFKDGKNDMVCFHLE